MKSRKVIIHGKEDVDIIEEELTSLADGEALIETELSLISAGTELSRVFALKKGASYPVYPGYCSVGRVLETGKNVRDVKPGDKVLFSAPHGSLHNFDPSRSDGGVLFRLDEKTPSEKAVYLEMCWIAMNGILPVDVKLMDKVAIFGAGTLGIILAQYYQLMGCETYILDPVRERCELAERNGVINTLSCPASQQVSELMQATEGEGVDIAVDATGLSKAIETAIEVTRKYGTVVLLGSPREEQIDNVSIPFYSIHSKMLNVVGALNRRYSFTEQPGTRISMKRTLKYMEKLINDGKLSLEGFISHRIDPDKDRLLEAYRGLMYKKNEYTGVIINWKK